MRAAKPKSRLSSKILASLMAVVLALGMAPLPAFAGQGEGDADGAATQAAETPRVQMTLRAGDAEQTSAPDQAPAADDAVTIAPAAAIVLTTQDGEAQNYAVFETIDGKGVLTFKYGVPAGTAGTDCFPFDDATTYWFNTTIPWRSVRQDVQAVVFDASVVGHLKPKTMAYWFYGFYNLTDVQGLALIDTSELTTIGRMFDGCEDLYTLDLTGFDTSNVTDMSRLFCGCDSLTNLTLGESFNTAKVTTMYEMFACCFKLANIDFPQSFDTGNVTNMEQMFHGCWALKSLDLSRFNTSKVTTFHQMFNFCKSLTALDLSSFSTESATTVGNMFADCESLKSVIFPEGFGKNVKSAESLFIDCKSLKAVDLSMWDTSSLANVSGMFSRCTALETVDLSMWDFSHVTRMGNMFSSCSALKSMNLGDLVTGAGCSMNSMFYGCTALDELDLSKWDTSKVTSMYYMFYGCSNLAKLDLSGRFDTSSVNWINNGFSYMFGDCKKLASITLGERFFPKGADMASSQYWAKFPTPPVEAPYCGLWWQGKGTSAYTPDEICELSGSEIAGEWTWCEASSVTLTCDKGGTATVAPRNTGAAGEKVTLTATPDKGYKFTGWSITSGENSGALASAADNPTDYAFGTESGTVKASFARDLDANEYAVGPLSQHVFTCNGKMQVPTVEVTDTIDGTVLTAGTDYTVSYFKDGKPVESPTEAGTYELVVTGAGTYAKMMSAPLSAGEFTIYAGLAVNGTLACESGWTPGANDSNWGSLIVMAPAEDGGYECVSTVWPAEGEFVLTDVEPGSQIIFTPQASSACGPVTYDVPADQVEAITGIALTAPYLDGVVQFDSLELVTVDRLYDSKTGADYTIDDDEATRTVSFALNKDGTRVKVIDAEGAEVPASVFDGKTLVIRDSEENLIADAEYTIAIGVNEPRFTGGSFRKGSDTYAVVYEAHVELKALEGEGGRRIGADDVAVKAYSQGRAVIHYSNPNGTSTSLFLYDKDGNLAGSALIHASGEGTIQTRFLDAGAYTLCAVENSVYTEQMIAYERVQDTPATLAEFEDLGFTEDQLVKRTFTVQDNALVDVGVNDPVKFPTKTKEGSVVDRANSSVTAVNSYSDYTTITIVVALQDGVDPKALEDPTLNIYTNQKQLVDSSMGTGNRNCWPRSCAINGKPVSLDDLPAMEWSMKNGWLYLNVKEYYPAYAGVESFPLTITLTVPRSNFDRTTASAYLKGELVGSFDEASAELSLAAPEITAEKSFTAHGYTAAGADVVLTLDGVEAATVTADEYGYYAAKIALPENVGDLDAFDLQASATWMREGVAHAANSEVLGVMYSTTKASLKRLWMLSQYGPTGVWDYLLVYDNGEWSSMYKGYGLMGSWAQRRFVWIAEFNNAEYATNVQCMVPQSEGDLALPMTRDYEQADAWLSLDNPGDNWYMRTLTMDTQSLVDDSGLAALGPRGKVDYRTGAQIIHAYLDGGNAYVSEPLHLLNYPSGVYVTYDHVERQTLSAEDPYLGNAGLAEDDLAAYINALNENSNNMVIVEKDLDADGNLVKVDPAKAAGDYLAADAGQVDEWIAVALGIDPDGVELEEPVWLQLHHTVETTAIADMSEPLGMITAAQSKYAEYLDSIREALAAGRSADEATAYCPCKEADNPMGGIPIKEMFVSADDAADSLRYFIWAEDSNGNTYVRSMEKYDVDGGGVAYRQYEADEKKLTITEWNGQTGQKTVLSYELAESSVDALDCSHDTDFGLLMSMWMFVGGQVQLGLDDAVNALAADPSNVPSDAADGGKVGTQSDLALTVQAKGGTLKPVAATGGTAKTHSWFDKLLNWREQALKDAGLITDWGTLSNSELQSVFKFLSDNKTGCLEIESKIQKSNDPSSGDPYGKMKASAFRGGLKRVYDTLKTAESFGQKFYKDGLGKAVEAQAKSYLRTKTREGYRDYVYNQRRMSTDTNLEKYSDEYIELVQALVDFERRAYENGNPNGYPPNCIDWSAIPDDLIYELKYARDNEDIYGVPERLQRLRGIGSIWPRGKHDPSGYVYEGMLSNPVAGATVTLYTYNGAGDPNDDHATLVDSEKFGYEPNPQVTGADGYYQWFVSTGYWQVRVTKEGYDSVSTGSSDEFGIGATKKLMFDKDGGAAAYEEDAVSTVEANTYWMPVLPDQVDVNIPLVSAAAPVLESAEGTEEGVLVTFSKPLKIDTVSADMFTLSGADLGTAVAPAAVESVDVDVAADGSLGADGNVQKLARTFLVRYPAGTVMGTGAHEVAVAFANAAGAAVSYAGTAAASGSITSKFIMNVVTVPAGATLVYNGKAQTGVAAGAGYTLSGATSATDAGSYVAKATLESGYVWADGTTEDKDVSWKIDPAQIKPTFKLSATSYTWNGKVKTPSVTVKVGSKTLVKGTDYTVTYEKGRKNVGTYKVKVVSKGNYSFAAKTLSFKINPKGATIKAPTAAKKAITVKWAKQAKKMSSSRITGYQVQVATNKAFTKNVKKANVNGYKKTSKKIAKLKAKTKYYVRVRTYKKVGSATYYSPWSKVKAVKTK